MAEETPLMRQYWSIKNAHLDKILLFRMGDFYEMFFDDAVKAAPILGIALTSRNKKSADETPMCGVPHHSIAGPINKLLAAGLKVALCEQVEDPKTAKGIVKRAVTRVMTPGMVYDPETLEQTRAYFIGCAIGSDLACVDTSTGESLIWTGLEESELRELITHLPLVEMLAPNMETFSYPTGAALTAWDLKPEKPIASLDSNHPLQLILSYIESSGLQISAEVVRQYRKMSLQGVMELSATTLKHLEVFQSSLGTPAGTLFSAIDRTKTPMGARRLRQRLAFPFKDLKSIETEMDRLQAWQERAFELKNLRSLLAGVGDLERRCLKMGLPTNNARDLLSLNQALEQSLEVLRQAGLEKKNQEKSFDPIKELSQKLARTLREDPPMSTKQGFMIRDGVDPLLDEAILFSTEGQNMLAQFEERQRTLSGISSLKVRYNQVFGYYIEITNTHKDKIPSHYLRKQTLANAERFTTDELIELERKIISAEVKRFDLEFHIFEELRTQALNLTTKILELARVVSDLDVVTSLAWLAVERGYVRPRFSEPGKVLLKASRHPVVEQSSSLAFVANDIELDENGVLLLTGPNMAGKSTLMRQVALTSILAQIGSYVPASSAELPLFDRILTRIGANDSLSEGLSTFMVEMKETSEILAKASSKSLVLLDEIGRGTSTYDGMSLAQALLEHFLTQVKCKVLFATHYHELTRLEPEFPNLKNAHMSIRESGGQIQFLYALRSGPALKSYGIQVARLAKLPTTVTQRAQMILEGLERSQMKVTQMTLWESPQSLEPVAEVVSGGMGELKPSPILEEMQELDLNQMTPMSALVKIEQWKQALKNSKSESKSSS